MKTMKVILSIMALTLFCISNSEAQKDHNYKHQFNSVDSSGIIKDESGNKIGTVTKEGIIKNHQGEKIAFIDNNGNLVDKYGKIIGKPEKNGNFHNINGEIVYTVKPGNGEQCEAFDKSGNVVATIHNNYKAQAGCISHCLKEKMLMK